MDKQRYKLTKTIVDLAVYPYPGQKRLHVIWDAVVPSFGLRVYPSGRKAFTVIYRFRGRQRMMSLGRFGVLTVQQARQLAREALVRVAQGEDPSRDRLLARDAPTVADLWQRYYREHAKLKKKARTAREDLRKWEMDIEPALGHLKIGAVQATDISSLHASLHHKPVQANRILALVSSMFSMAERWGLRPEGTNPCRHIQRYREGKRERYLTSEELVRLGEALAEVEASNEESPEAVAAIRLLLLTGCASPRS